MADMLSSGISGLLAFQRSLDTTSHNIANASTPGYSRQTVMLGTRGATPMGEGWIGNGVDVVAINRNYSQILATQVQNATSTFQHLDAYSSLAETLTNTFTDSTTGISKTVQDFANSLQTLASSPADPSTRQTVLSSAGTLVTRLQSYQNSLDQLSARVESGVSDEVTRINSLAQGVADLNKRVIAAKGQSSGAANDLLDQRDALVSELAQHINISTINADDGSVNVYVGSGQAIVMGSQTFKVVTSADPFDPEQQRLGVATSNYTSDITDSISGGTLGGLLQFRSDMLDPARQSVGQIAVGLATQLNTIQSQGLDLNGNIGKDLFNLGGVLSLPSARNTGTASIAATRTDVPAITPGSYTLAYDGSAWSLTDQATGSAVALAGTGTAADPFVGGGLSLVVTGTAQAGDKYQIDPWSGAVDGMKVALTDPNEIASAGQVVTSATATNSGTGTIGAGSVADNAAWVRGDYTLSFTSASAWQVTDSGGNTVASGAYTAGTPISFNGIDVTVGGAPAAGDSFSVNDNADGSGDNRNILSMVAAFDQDFLKGGTASVNGTVDAFTTRLATSTSQVDVARDAQQSTLEDATSALQSVTGVNLDEEAAKLIQYQQAYQAAAQVIAIANTLFDSLLNAVRG